MTTQTKVKEVHIEEMMRDAGIAPEPGGMQNTVAHEATPEVPFRVGVGKIESAGYVTVWDNRSGEQIPVNKNMLASVIRKRRDDGSLIWTTVDPHIKPRRGSLPCMLNPKHPLASDWADLGFAPCRKSTLPTPSAVEVHMKHRHSQEWASIEDRDRKVIEAEERTLRRLNIEAMMRQSPEPRVTHHPQAEAPKAAVEAAPGAEAPAFTGNCLTCAKEFSAKTKAGLSSALRFHQMWHKKQLAPS